MIPRLAAALLAPLLLAATPDAVPRISHVTIVLMENRNYASVVGSAEAPYFNGALRRQSLLLQNSHAVAHPSEPNYLALFSGSTHGVSGDQCPLSYDSPNLSTLLAAAGAGFGGYAESMPADGFTGCYTSNGLYARKHVPWVNFTNVPATENRIYKSFPAIPPAVTWITPNMCNDMHDCSTRTGDRWLQQTLPPIIAWDAANDGLLIVTWDEADPDPDGTNRIPTVLAGPMVRSGVSDRRIDHYGILRTIELALGLGCVANDCRATPLNGIWQ